VHTVGEAIAVNRGQEGSQALCVARRDPAFAHGFPNVDQSRDVVPAVGSTSDLDDQLLQLAVPIAAV
jgi:hypothetical protein